MIGKIHRSSLWKMDGDHGGFLGRVFQKVYNKKINDGVFGTYQNIILENILYNIF
jgi:hypothetical protein